MNNKDDFDKEREGGVNWEHMISSRDNESKDIENEPGEVKGKLGLNPFPDSDKDDDDS